MAPRGELYLVDVIGVKNIDLTMELSVSVCILVQSMTYDDFEKLFACGGC